MSGRKVEFFDLKTDSAGYIINGGAKNTISAEKDKCELELHPVGILLKQKGNEDLLPYNTIKRIRLAAEAKPEAKSEKKNEAKS